MRQLLLLVLFVSITSASFAYDEDEKMEDKTWHVALGAIGLILQKYQGANQYRFLAFPNFEVNYKRKAFLSVYRGLGFNLGDTNGFRAGGAIRYQFKGRGSRSKRFPGLNNTFSFIEGHVYGSYRFEPFKIKLNLTHAINRLNYGGTLGFDASYRCMLHETLRLTIGPGVRFANNNAMKTFYGISTSQSAASGLPVFRARGGLESVSVKINTFYSPTDNWSIYLLSAIRYLSYDAGASPITSTRFKYFGAIGVNYIFG